MLPTPNFRCETQPEGDAENPQDDVIIEMNEETSSRKRTRIEVIFI